MSDEELEPLAASLKELFVEERSRGAAPAGAKARELARLRSVMTPGGGGGGGSGAGASTWGKLALTFGAGTVAGGLVVYGATAPRVVHVDRIVEVPVSIGVPASASVVLDAPPPPPVEVTSAAPPRPSAAPSASNAGGTLAAERAILDVARTALGRGDGEHALLAIERHVRQFPAGQMTEEREAIAIQALVKSGRKEDAAARGARFRKRYPNSVLMVVVDAALEQ